MDANQNPSIKLANLFGFDAATNKVPIKQPKITIKDCVRYAARIDYLARESNNHLSLFQPIQIDFCKTRKVFKTLSETKENPHTQLSFDPFEFKATTGKDFLFLSRISDYLIFNDAVPYAPYVPHKAAVLNFLNYFHIVPDYVVASPFGLTQSALDQSIRRFQASLDILEYEISDYCPRSKMKKIVESEIEFLVCELEKLKHISALSKIT
jgi:hypothetical protein